MPRSSGNKKQDQMASNNPDNKPGKNPDTSRTSNQGRKLASGGSKETTGNNGKGRSKNK